MTLNNAMTIGDVTNEDIIDFREIATWLRDFADPELYDVETFVNDIREEADAAVAALLAMLMELGYRDVEPGWAKMADRLQELGDNYGAALIRGTYWLDYVKDYAAETTDSGNNTPVWPFNHIDWESAARELGTDYCEVTLAGVDFLIREF